MSVRVPCMGIVDYLTSSPEYGTAIVSVPCAVVPASGLVALLLLLLLLLQEYHHRRCALSFPPSLSHISGQLACLWNATAKHPPSILTTTDKDISIILIID